MRSIFLLWLTFLALPVSAAPDTSDLLEQLKDPDANTRARAARLLGEQGEDPELAVPALVRATADESAIVRSLAIGSIGKLGPGAKAATPVLVAALRDADEDIRAAAALAVRLVAPGAPETFLALLALIDDPSWEVQAIALEALSQFGPRAVPAVPLCMTFLRHENLIVRKGAAIALGRIGAGASRARDALRAVAKDDPDESVRKFASRALKSISQPLLPATPAPAGALGPYPARATRPDDSPVRARAVDLALWWLARHQQPDGSWSASEWPKRCEGELPKRQKGTNVGQAGFDTGLTALVTLAFLGAGHSPQGGDYQDVVAHALRWLAAEATRDKGPWRAEEPAALGHGVVILTQTPIVVSEPVDGKRVDHVVGFKEEKKFFRHFDVGWRGAYGLALTTLAVNEAFGMTRDPSLEPLAKQLTERILKRRTPDSGWGYGPRSDEVETALSGWMLLAVWAAKTAGLAAADEPLTGVVRWVSTMAAKDRVRCRSLLLYFDSPCLLDGDDPTYFSERGMSSIALLTKILAGGRPGSLRLRELKKRVIGYARGDFHAEFFRAEATRLLGGKAWRQRSKLFAGVGQIEKTCARGSWDGVGKWCRVGGRVYATAIKALTLEVPYRSSAVEPGPEKAQAVKAKKPAKAGVEDPVAAAATALAGKPTAKVRRNGLKALVRAAQSRSPERATAAQKALSEVPKAVAAAAVKDLRAKSSRVRSRAAEALGWLGSVAAVDALVGRLRDDDVFVRAAAAQALGRIGKPAASAIRALRRSAEDPDEAVRRAAEAALAAIED